MSFAREGRKALPFGKKFGMLGLEVGLEACSHRKLHIGHTEARREELCLFIDDIMSANEINQKTIERLRGRMVFFECYFSERVPAKVMDSLLSVSEHPIYELELLPVLVSYRAWGQRMKGAQLVVYLDNDAARHSLIRGVSGTSNGSVILERILQLEDALSLKVWYARVPTYSNIADGPSRGSCDVVQGLGSTRCQICASVLQP